MKAIVRYLILLLLVCGTALAWKSSDRRFRGYSASGGDSARQKEDGETMQAALQPLMRGPSLTVSTWSKSEFQGKLEEAFQKSDPCVVIDMLSQTKRSEEHTSELQSQFHLVCR